MVAEAHGTHAAGVYRAKGSVAIAQITGPSRFNRSKLEAYECGIEPSDQPANAPHAGSGQRFPVKYYLTAMLFIVFDIEIVFLYPWAVSYDQLGLFALIEMVRERIRRYRDAGVQLLISSAYKNDAETLELLAADVMPRFAV